MLKDAYIEWWKANAAIAEPIDRTMPVDKAIKAPPLVMVATAGGASRAALSMAQVLGEIAAREPRVCRTAFHDQRRLRRIAGGGDVPFAGRSRSTYRQELACLLEKAAEDSRRDHREQLPRSDLRRRPAIGLLAVQRHHDPAPRGFRCCPTIAACALGGRTPGQKERLPATARSRVEPGLRRHFRW